MWRWTGQKPPWKMLLLQGRHGQFYASKAATVEASSAVCCPCRRPFLFCKIQARPWRSCVRPCIEIQQLTNIFVLCQFKSGNLITKVTLKKWTRCLLRALGPLSLVQGTGACRENIPFWHRKSRTNRLKAKGFISSISGERD